MTAPRDRSLAVGGLTFHYVTWGPESAPPLVLLHGLTSQARSWDALGRELSADFHVIALDQRGHRDSDRAPDGNYRVGTMAADLAGFVDAIGLDRFAPLGLSMGGRVGIAYAGGHAARIERPCIVDIVALARWLPRDFSDDPDAGAQRVPGQVGQRQVLHLDHVDGRAVRAGRDRLVCGELAGARDRLVP